MKVFFFLCLVGIVITFFYMFTSAYVMAFNWAMGADQREPDVDPSHLPSLTFFQFSCLVQVALLIRAGAQSLVYTVWQNETAPPVGWFWRGLAVFCLLVNLALFAGVMPGFEGGSVFALVLACFLLFSLIANTPLKLLAPQREII